LGRSTSITAIQAVLPGMRARGAGTILVSTGASSGPFIHPPFANIAAASGALRNWILNLHAALQPAAHRRRTVLPRRTMSAYRTNMTNAELETRYREYLDALNQRRLDDLVHYVHDQLTYNGKSLTRQQYRDMIATDIAAIPDLVFDAHIIVADDHRVACRLVFHCTPRHTFLGFAPNGERLSFTEHVFYHFIDGRIAQVSSLIDRYAIQTQLRNDAP
jgi:predicted ester cyclase